MNQILKKIYEDANFPGFERFYKFVKTENPEYKKVDVKKFYDSKISVQLLKKKDNKIKKTQGAITSTYINELFQMDICDMTAKFSKYNSNYRYILLCIDIFSRKAFGVAIKSKKIDETIDAFKKIIFGNKPISLFSDQDATFNSNQFTDMLKENNIIYNINTLNDHRSLSIIDSFTKKLKLSLTNHMLENNTNNWIDQLPIFLRNYNSLPHSSLNDIQPNKVHLTENNSKIFNINSIKKKKNILSSDLHIGNMVRINIRDKFSKGNDLQMSSEIYKVVEIKGSNITLDDGKVFKRDKLLNITNNMPELQSKIKIDDAIKSGKVNKLLQIEGVDKSNIVKSKKSIKKTLKIDGIDASNIVSTKRRSNIVTFN